MVSGKVGFEAIVAEPIVADAIVADTPEVVDPSVVPGTPEVVGCPLVVCTCPLEPVLVVMPAEPAT